MKLSLTVLLLFQFFNLISEVKKDTSVHNYLIAVPKVIFRHTHIYKEGSRFMIMDTLQQKHWGNLHIINDSTISLVSGKTEETDTFMHNSPKLTPYFQSKLTPLKVIDILSSKLMTSL